jgi:iron complex transport system permease protein
MSTLSRKEMLGPAAIALLLLFLAIWPAWLAIAPGLQKTTPAVTYDVHRMVLVYSTLPRLATAFIAGAALALSGALFQHVLRNPLASPTTLGISAGANVMLAVSMLFFPGLLGIGRDGVALIGSALAACVVFAVGSRRGFSPLSLVLSGMLISLWCGSLAAMLTLLNDRYLVSLFIWGAGSLAQESWDIPLALFLKTMLLAIACAFILRPLALLELGEGGAIALGVKLFRLRLTALAIAVALSAFVTSAVGVIGFIGLVGPIAARLAGARRASHLFIWSGLIGGALLLLTDAATQVLAGALSDFLPTGAVTAVFGSPLLLILLPQVKLRHRAAVVSMLIEKRYFRPKTLALGAFCLLIVTILLAALVGRSTDGGWVLLPIDRWDLILPLRLPKILAALACGSMLAAAGTILQRLTGNEMASPEVLGVSAGATLGLVAAVFALAAPGLGAQFGFASAGALIVLLLILLFALRSGLAPERVLLAGIALSAMIDAVVGVLSATGDPRALLLLRWMSGSTYNVDWQAALASACIAAVLVGSTLRLGRWLDLLPLGPPAAMALGVPLTRARLVLFLLAGLLSAVATICVGPLTFVGLMAPHLAREIGLRRAAPQLVGAVAVGACLMVIADWIGRTIAFPYQLPAGLVSALIGAPFLMLMLRRKG